MPSKFDNHFACVAEGCLLQEKLVEASLQHRELDRLQNLNTALFTLFTEARDSGSDFYSAGHDRVVGEYRPRVDGDFFWVRRFGASLFVVFGDAHGHYAYAGGLKMYVASVMNNLVREWPADGFGPNEILTRLASAFELLNESHEQSAGSRLADGGIDVVVLVLNVDGHATFNAAISSQMPAFLVESDHQLIDVPLTVLKGRRRQKGIQFEKRRNRSQPELSDPQMLDVSQMQHIVLLTDGFTEHRRSTALSGIKEPLTPGALKRFVSQACAAASADGGASSVAAGILNQMKEWREGYEIDPQDDDDRLVLVIDIRRTMAHLSEPVDSVSVPSVDLP